jgi:hypothetical protein
MAFDFSATGFIQLLNRKVESLHAFFCLGAKRCKRCNHEIDTNVVERLRQTPRDRFKPQIARTPLIGERSPRRVGLKAWPLLRIRCSGATAETISSPRRARRSRRYFESGNQEPRNRGNGISEIEGKDVQGSVEPVGRRASFNRGNGISEIEGKAALGSSCSFVPIRGLSELSKILLESSAIRSKCCNVAAP